MVVKANKKAQPGDRVESVETKDPSFSTDNPVSKLQFQTLQRKKTNKINFLNIFLSNNSWMFVPALILIFTSISLNKLLLEKLDPGIFTAMSFSKSLVLDQFTKPYVVTLGEFGNLGIAKEEAVKLLPQLRQVNIKQLKSGIYTFEIERFSAKKKAYFLADEFMQKGFDVVHVRYLPDQ